MGALGIDLVPLGRPNVTSCSYHHLGWHPVPQRGLQGLLAGKCAGIPICLRGPSLPSKDQARFPHFALGTAEAQRSNDAVSSGVGVCLVLSPKNPTVSEKIKAALK